MNGNSGCHIAVVIFNLQVIDSDVLPSGKLFAYQPPETVFAVDILPRMNAGDSRISRFGFLFDTTKQEGRGR